MGQKNRNGNLWNRVDIEKVPGDERVGTGLLNLIIYQSDIATQIKKRKIKIAFSLHKRKELLVHFKILKLFLLVEGVWKWLSGWSNENAMKMVQLSLQLLFICPQQLQQRVQT